MKHLHSDEDLDNLFRKKLADDSIPPTEKLWPGITAELDEDRRKPALIYWIIAGLGLLLVLGGILFFNGRSKENNKIVSQHSSEFNSENSPNNNATNGASGSENKNSMNIDITPDQTTNTRENTLADNNSSIKNNSTTSEHTGDQHSDPHANYSYQQNVTPITFTRDHEPDVNKNDDKTSEKTNDEKKDTKPDENKKDDVKGGDVEKKTDGSLPTIEKTAQDTPKVVLQPKPDSVPQLPLKKDSVLAQQPVKDTTKHSSDPKPITPGRPRLFYASLFYALQNLNSSGISDQFDMSGHDPATTFFAKSAGIIGKYSLGGKFGYFLSKRIALEAELNYSYLENNSNEFIMTYWRWANPLPQLNVNSAFGNVIIPASKFDMNDNSRPQYYIGDSVWIRGTVNEKYQFMNIPLSIRADLLQLGSFRLYIRAGGSANYIVSEDLKFTVTRSGKTIEYKTVNDLRKLTMGINSGAGAELLLYKGIGIWAEAGYRYSISSLNKNSKNHPGALSIPFGLTWHF